MIDEQTFMDRPITRREEISPRLLRRAWFRGADGQAISAEFVVFALEEGELERILREDMTFLGFTGIEATEPPA